MLEAHWRPEGFTVPHASVYPWQWLWDSCFHVVIWAELGDAERALAELTTALGGQDASGFVPHMTYHDDARAQAAFWGRERTSSITQPPMFGHAVAELTRRGITVPDPVLDRAVAGLRFLLERRTRAPGGLVTVVHPWETGCDDSPRWDGWCPGGYDPTRFRALKGELLATVERDGNGAPVANPAFAVAPVGFNALLAWNARELAAAVDDARLLAAADELAAVLDSRWDAELVTWVDDGPHGSGRVRTADALLPALLGGPHREEALTAASAPAGLGGGFGVAGTDRRERAYDPVGYWRGSVWPQLTYLLWRAAAGHPTAGVLADGLRAGAAQSGLAEYWHPDTGEGHGAIPQSWTGLALLV
jgi:hypothetical protein